MTLELIETRNYIKELEAYAAGFRDRSIDDTAGDYDLVDEMHPPPVKRNSK